MIIDIDLTGATAAIDLVGPEDCTRFHLTVRGGGSEALAAALSAADIGRLLPSGDAMIDTQAVRLMASGKVPTGWDTDFNAMLEYARSKGWLDDAGAVQAHIEWVT